MSKGMDKWPDKVLCMRAGDMKVCLDVSCIIKVILLPQLERCPNVSLGLIGMLNYAGNSVYVMDLYTLMSGHRERAYTLDNSIVIIGSGNRLSGLMVDEIEDIRQIDVNEIQQIDKFDKNSSLIAGSIIFDNELYMLLNSNLEKYVNLKITEDKTD